MSLGPPDIDVSLAHGVIVYATVLGQAIDSMIGPIMAMTYWQELSPDLSGRTAFILAERWKKVLKWAAANALVNIFGGIVFPGLDSSTTKVVGEKDNKVW
ncbi:hypothetical protein K470DRAFT_269612 [Piedraia hortae CBS 480.64]|uniref:Uncharacterized protein n=1 Tax=Piedraia hortae CBS 480.64 TaxID=1314780 RepID=A0A6A7C519_9PEZI|nr:hypothetical protein K470DRAFT_269612 [Piedraia hortae CBS 480.64]